MDELIYFDMMRPVYWGSRRHKGNENRKRSGHWHAMSDGNNRFESHSHDIEDDEERIG